MELTLEQTQKMIADGLKEYPEIAELVSRPTFKQGLKDIAEFEGIDPSMLPLIENNLMVVLAFYAPLSELAQNMREDTGLPIQKMQELSVMIDSILLSDIHEELIVFDYLWNHELEKNLLSPEALESKERLDLRPTMAIPASSASKPLTREELLSALSGKRTMAGDIDAVRQQQTGFETTGSSNG